MTIENKIEETEYLVKPWLFGRKDSLGDRMLFAPYTLNLLVGTFLVPLLTFKGLNGDDGALSIAISYLATTLIGYCANEIQVHGLTRK